jgi:hypothetical protein
MPSSPYDFSVDRRQAHVRVLLIVRSRDRLRLANYARRKDPMVRASKAPLSLLEANLAGGDQATAVVRAGRQREDMPENVLGSRTFSLGGFHQHSPARGLVRPVPRRQAASARANLFRTSYAQHREAWRRRRERLVECQANHPARWPRSRRAMAVVGILLGG